MDLAAEVHDTHHPIAVSLYYEDQKEAAKPRADHFIKERMPKYLGYFERVLERTDAGFLLGGEATYPDLSLFLMVEGLRYTFPNAMKAAEGAIGESSTWPPRCASCRTSPHTSSRTAGSGSTSTACSGSIPSWTSPG